MLDILDTVNQWIAGGDPIVLATVTQTWGSGPRRPGAKMAFTEDGRIIGSVSGGCIEGDVIESGLDGLANNRARLLHYGVADDTAWEVGLTCGGKINVFVEPLDYKWWQQTAGAVQADQTTKTVTVVDGEQTGEKILVDASGTVQYTSPGLNDEQIRAFQAVAGQTHRTGQVTHEAQTLLVDVYQPRPHLIIVGGVHVAMPLQQMAEIVGFRVSIVDPRSAFATEARFPDVDAILHSYPQKALPELGLDQNTYLAVLTHDPKIDDKALLTALPVGIPYIGVLSSSRTHEKRVKRLKEAGLSDDLINTIRTPIGIDIGASTPEEIALCIMAEIVAVRNGVNA